MKTSNPNHPLRNVHNTYYIASNTNYRVPATTHYVHMNTCRRQVRPSVEGGWTGSETNCRETQRNWFMSSRMRAEGARISRTATHLCIIIMMLMRARTAHDARRFPTYNRVPIPQVRCNALDVLRNYEESRNEPYTSSVHMRTWVCVTVCASGNATTVECQRERKWTYFSRTPLPPPIHSPSNAPSADTWAGIRVENESPSFKI